MKPIGVRRQSKWQGWLTIVGGVLIISIWIAVWRMDLLWHDWGILLWSALDILIGVILCIVGIRDLLPKRGQG